MNAGGHFFQIARPATASLHQRKNQQQRKQDSVEDFGDVFHRAPPSWLRLARLRGF